MGKVQQMSVKNVLVKKENVSLHLAFDLGKSQTAPFFCESDVYIFGCVIGKCLGIGTET